MKWKNDERRCSHIMVVAIDGEQLGMRYFCVITIYYYSILFKMKSNK